MDIGYTREEKKYYMNQATVCKIVSKLSESVQCTVNEIEEKSILL